MTRATSRAGSGSPVKKQMGRRIYVFAVVACVAFLILACFFNRHTRLRESGALISLQVSPHSNPSEVRNLLISTVQHVTNDDALLDSVKFVSKNCVIHEGALRSGDAEQIRKQLKVASHTVSPSEIQIAVGFTGLGTEDEQALVNRIANQIAGELPQQSLRLAVAKQNSAARNDATTSVFAATAHDLRSLNNEVRAAQIQLENLQRTFAEFKESPAEVSEINPEWKLLNAEISQLRNDKRKMTEERGYTEAHPEVFKLQQQIEAKSYQLSGMDKRKPSATGQMVEERRVNNQFFSVANRKQANVSADEVENELKMVNLDRIAQATNGLQERIQAGQRAAASLGISEHQLTESTPVMQKIDYAEGSHRVKVDVPTKIGIPLLFSVLLGGVLAWRYNPQTHLTRFQSADEVAKSLQLPIMTTLVDDTRLVPPRQKGIANGVVKGFEWIGLSLLGVVLLACVVNGNILATLVESPTYAMTRIIWIIFG